MESSSVIIGAGGALGGGGKGKSSSSSAPSEAEVSLRSRASVTAVFLLGEGVWEGGANPDLAKCVYLNETPIKNADDSFNFSNVYLDFRPGTRDQTYMPLGGGSVGAEIPVDVKVTQVNGAVTRSFTDSTATAYKIRVMTPALRRVDKNDIKGTEIKFRVELSVDGGAFQLQFEDTISGYTPSPYQRTYRRSLPTGNTFSVRVTRLTADSNSTALSNDLYWQALASVTDVKQTYANSAVAVLRVVADQFQSLPSFAIDAKRSRVLVPHNYNPITRQYSGMFNGSLVEKWTDNPAWCFYDLATNSRYGMGKYVTQAGVDVTAMYAIGQYCDGLVPDGKGGMEPRFTCNVYIQDADEASNVLAAMASVFRGMLYYANGMVTATQDKPKSATRIFTEANVIQQVGEDGKVEDPPFKYSGTGIKATHTAAIVYYNDLNDFGRRVPVYVEDKTQLDRFGYNPIEITAFACNSEGQAYRTGEWLIASERYRDQTITFTAGSEAMLMRLGEVIKVYDPLQSQYRRAGRIISCTANSVTIDAPVTLGATVYTLTMFTPGALTIERVLTNGVGTTSTLTWTTPIPSQEIPMPNQTWGIESSDILATLWEVRQITPLSDSTYEIVGLKYVPGLYDYVERDQPLPIRDTTTLPDPRRPPLPPINLQLEESLYSAGAAGNKVRLDLSWQPNKKEAFGLYYEVEYAGFGDTQWRYWGRTQQTTISSNDARTGYYKFRVRTESITGAKSAWTYRNYNILGSFEAPAQVQNFTVTASDNFAFLKWTPTEDVDVSTGGKFKIKHTPKISNVSWNDGSVIAEVSGAASTAQVPLMSGTYQIKAVDANRQESVVPAIATLINVPEVLKMNNVLTIDEAPLWAGTKVNVANSNGELRLNSSGYVSQYAGFISGVPNFRTLGTPFVTASSGSYTFANTVDLGEVFTSRVTPLIDYTIVDERDTIASRPGNVSTWKTFSGASLEYGVVLAYVSTSLDGIAWTPWELLTGGDYKARYFKFNLELDGEGSNYNLYIYSAKVTIDMPDRIESDTITVPASTTTISFANKFRNTPTVGVTIQNGATGDYPSIPSGSITSDGFTITVRNSANALVSRTISWMAKGYGKV